MFCISQFRAVVPLFVVCFVVVAAQNGLDCQGQDVACKEIIGLEPTPEAEEAPLKNIGNVSSNPDPFVNGKQLQQQNSTDARQSTNGKQVSGSGDTSPQADREEPQGNGDTSPKADGQHVPGPVAASPQQQYYRNYNPVTPTSYSYQYQYLVGTQWYTYPYQYPVNTNQYNYQYQYPVGNSLSSLCSPVPLYCHDMSKTTRYIFDWVNGCHPSHQCVWMGFASYYECVNVCMS